MAGLSYAPVLQVDNRLVATLCRCTRHLPYVLSTFTLGPVQLLGTSVLRPRTTLEPVHPLAQTPHHVPNTVGPLVELTGHHERLSVGHG